MSTILTPVQYRSMAIILTLMQSGLIYFFDSRANRTYIDVTVSRSNPKYIYILNSSEKESSVWHFFSQASGMSIFLIIVKIGSMSSFLYIFFYSCINQTYVYLSIVYQDDKIHYKITWKKGDVLSIKYDFEGEESSTNL